MICFQAPSLPTDCVHQRTHSLGCSGRQTGLSRLWALAPGVVHPNLGQTMGEESRISARGSCPSPGRCHLDIATAVGGLMRIVFRQRSLPGLRLSWTALASVCRPKHRTTGSPLLATTTKVTLSRIPSSLAESWATMLG